MSVVISAEKLAAVKPVEKELDIYHLGRRWCSIQAIDGLTVNGLVEKIKELLNIPTCANYVIPYIANRDHLVDLSELRLKDELLSSYITCSNRIDLLFRVTEDFFVT